MCVHVHVHVSVYVYTYSRDLFIAHEELMSLMTSYTSYVVYVCMYICMYVAIQLMTSVGLSAFDLPRLYSSGLIASEQFSAFHRQL